MPLKGWSTRRLCSFVEILAKSQEIIPSEAIFFKATSWVRNFLKHELSHVYSKEI